VSASEAIAVPLRDLPGDVHRGTTGMILMIVTEAFLFAVLFFAYFYVGQRHRPWPLDPPEIKLALILLAVLLTSSVVLHLGEKAMKDGRPRAARSMIVLTIVLGIGFLIVQSFEYKHHLEKLLPTSNAYGSLFYVITSFHALHVVVGLLMLMFVACLPRLRPHRAPHMPVHNVSLYWHFVDVVWIFVVCLLYLLPRAHR
jgi:heme/copper-type cytochrome/quinol oxidase subunit 3